MASWGEKIGVREKIKKGNKKKEKNYTIKGRKA